MQNEFQPKRAWAITGILSGFTLLNNMDKIVLGMVAVPLMTELSLTSVEFGVLAGSIYWLFAISGVLGGFAANRVPARWLLLGMAWMWSVVQLPIMFSSSFAIILFARVLLGIGEGPAAPVAAHAVYKWFPNDKRNLPVTVLNLGSTIGLLLAGFLIPTISAKWGWRANFVFLAVAGLVWGAIWLLFGAEGTIDKQDNANGVTASPLRMRYSALLTDPTIVGIFLVHFAAYWAFALTLTWLPAYFQKGLHYEAITSGKLFALVVLIGVPVNLGLSGYSQRLLSKGVPSRKGRALLLACTSTFSCLLFCLPMLYQFESMSKVIVLALACAFAPITFALCPAMMGEVSPPAQRGAMLAIENSFASIAGIIAPIVTGHLVGLSTVGSATGYESGFAICGLLMAMSAAAAWLLIHPERSRYQSLLTTKGAG